MDQARAAKCVSICYLLALGHIPRGTHLTFLVIVLDRAPLSSFVLSADNRNRHREEESGQQQTWPLPCVTAWWGQWPWSFTHIRGQKHNLDSRGEEASAYN